MGQHYYLTDFRNLILALGLVENVCRVVELYGEECGTSTFFLGSLRLLFYTDVLLIVLVDQYTLNTIRDVILNKQKICNKYSFLLSVPDYMIKQQALIEDLPTVCPVLSSWRVL